MGERRRRLTSLKRKAKPMTRGLGGRKFFLPLIMKDPTVKYSPVGAVFDTCNPPHSCGLQYAAEEERDAAQAG